MPDPFRRTRRPVLKLTASAVCLSVLVVGMAAGAFTALQYVFPWMTLTQEPEALARVDAATSQLRLVPATSSTPAQETVALLEEFDLSGYDSWNASEPSSSLTALSFGFGCDSTDGLAPVSSMSRTWSAPTSEGVAATVSITLSAYPAAGGPVAFAAVGDAAAGCEQTYLDDVPVPLGSAAMRVDTRRAAVVMWTRGDVIASAFVQRDGRPGDVTNLLPSLTDLDSVLASRLDETCADPNAGAVDAVRSPYLSPARYAPLSDAVAVNLPDVEGRRTARDYTDAISPDRIPPAGPLPAQPTLATSPAPAPTRGPIAQPEPVESPVPPVEPTAPPSTGSAVKAVQDRVGPGCGWSFTDQVPPRFDSERAAQDFARAKRAEQARLLSAWQDWQRARATYWEAYERYVRAAERFREYAGEVAVVNAAWTVINDARAVYEDAYTTYLAAVAGRADFDAAYDQALTDYEAAVAECENAPDPTASASPTTSPTASPSAAARRVPSCPPALPAILSSSAPPVPDRPTPAPEAQLPQR